MSERQKMSNAIRDPSPCRDCTERFIACSDRCPKDARGEYGHKAWSKEIARVKNERRKYINRANIRRRNYNEGEIYGKR